MAVTQLSDVGPIGDFQTDDEIAEEEKNKPETNLVYTPEFVEAVNATMKAIDEAQAKSASFNEQVKAKKNMLKGTYGMPKKAINAIISVRELTPEDLRLFDLAYTHMRRAIGKPIQADLFDEVKS